MSNIIPANFKVPAHLSTKVGAPSVLGAALAGGLASGGHPRISIKASRFRIVEDGTETVLKETSIDVVIVGANPRLSKIWYAKTWTPDDEPTAPDCFSLDGVRPDPESTDPQNDLCASCPQNAWGSKVTPQGKQIKACADQKRLAVVAADDPSGPVYLLQVTPAALAGLNKYQKELSVRGIPAEIVRTTVGFDTDASFPKLTFSFGGFIDEETHNAVEGLFGSDQVLEITGEKPMAPAVAAPAKPAPKPKATVVEEEEVAPAVEDAAEDSDTDSEPETPKRGFGAARKTAAKPEAKPKPAVKAAAKPAAKPKPAVVEADDSDDLADEIAALIGDADEDDE